MQNYEFFLNFAKTNVGRCFDATMENPDKKYYKISEVAEIIKLPGEPVHYHKAAPQRPGHPVLHRIRHREDTYGGFSGQGERASTRCCPGADPKQSHQCQSPCCSRGAPPQYPHPACISPILPHFPALTRPNHCGCILISGK